MTARVRTSIRDEGAAVGIRFIWRQFDDARRRHHHQQRDVIVAGFVERNVNDDADDVVDDASRFIPILVILVLVLAALCVLMGLVYAYIYFTRIADREKKKKRKVQKIDPHSVHHHHHHHHHHHKDDDRGSNATGLGLTNQHQTHMFLFKKFHHPHHANVIK